MLVKIARLSLILITIFTLAIFLPDFYWKAFEPQVYRPFAQFSPVLKDFLVTKASKKGPHYYDTKGHTYTRSEVDSLLPFSNARQLLFENRFPDSLDGKKIDPEEVRTNNFTLRISPSDINQYRIDLYPLFESQSGRVRLEMPTSFFRITRRMEFINAADNKIEEKLSSLFSGALQNFGFQFPAQLIAGNPTTRKPFDEGYFIVDASRHLFHLKMVKGEPVIHPVPIPENLKITHLVVQEMNLREFYALMITDDSRIFLLSYPDYQLIEVPVIDYNWNSTDIRIIGDLFYRNVMCYNEAGLSCQVCDRNYHPVASYQEWWGSRYQQKAGIISEYLFPFSLQIRQETTMFIGLFLRISGIRSLIGIGVVVLLTWIFLSMRGFSVKRNWLEFVIVMVSGIFGFIAIILYPPLRDKF